MVWEGYRACGYGRGVKGIGVWERHGRYGGALGTGEYGGVCGVYGGVWKGRGVWESMEHLRLHNLNLVVTRTSTRHGRWSIYVYTCFKIPKVQNKRVCDVVQKQKKRPFHACV